MKTQTTPATRIRLVRHTDKPGIRVCNFNGMFKGQLMAQFDQFLWVLWDNAGEIKGCWQPDTENRSNIWVTE